MGENRLLKAIFTEVVEMKKEITKMGSDMSDMKSDITELKSDVVELKSDVVELKSDVAELKSDVAELKLDVAELKGEVKRLDKKIDSNYELLEKFYVEQMEWNTGMEMRVQGIEARQLVYETQVQRNTYNIEQLLKSEKT